MLAMRTRAFQRNHLLNHGECGYLVRPRRHRVIQRPARKVSELQKVDLDCRSPDQVTRGHARCCPESSTHRRRGSCPVPPRPDQCPRQRRTTRPHRPARARRPARRSPLRATGAPRENHFSSLRCGTGPARSGAPPARRAAGHLARAMPEGQDAPPGVGGTGAGDDHGAGRSVSSGRCWMPAPGGPGTRAREKAAGWPPSVATQPSQHARRSAVRRGNRMWIPSGADRA